MKSLFSAIMPITHDLQNLLAAEARGFEMPPESLPSALCGPAPSRPSRPLREIDAPPSLRAKYIIVDLAGIELAILLPEAIQHAWAIDQLHKTPISAGFFSVHWSDGSESPAQDGCSIPAYTIHVEPTGSESLNLDPRPAKDTAAITDTLYLMGLL